mgnify:CR=1 FL=1
MKGPTNRRGLVSAEFYNWLNQFSSVSEFDLDKQRSYQTEFSIDFIDNPLPFDPMPSIDGRRNRTVKGFTEATPKALPAASKPVS